MSEQPADRADLVSELRRLRSELARAFDRIPYAHSSGDVRALRQQAEKVESELSELIERLE